jgi:pimeloyl-ACP methyl ester carboxylesterase
MEDIEPIPFWTNEDPRLHLLSWEGEGLPLLLLHGMGGSVHWWDGVAPRLVQSFKPVAVDFAGHGDSGWDPEGRYGLDAYVDNVELARHSLGWSKMAVIGHSMGGRVALEYAAKFPQRVVAVGALDFLTELDSGTEGRFMRARKRPQPVYKDALELIQRFRLQPEGTLLTGEELRELGEMMIKKAAQGGWTWRFDWRAFGFEYPPVWPTLEKVGLPALVMRGEMSEVMPKADFERVVKGLKNGKGIELKRAYHHITLDDSAGTAAAINQFFSCLPSAAS